MNTVRRNGLTLPCGEREVNHTVAGSPGVFLRVIPNNALGYAVFKRRVATNTY